MRRIKYDWTKPLKPIDNKKTFDQLDTNEESLVIVIPVQDPNPIAPHQKQQIPVPKIDTVPRITEVKKFAKISANYIRLPPHLNLPVANSYQLTEVDHIFLKSHQDRFLFKGKRVLTADFLRKAFVELQLKAGKDMVLPRSKGWMLNFVEKEYKQILNMDNFQTFADTVYNFWKNRREDLKFPLLRQLWKPNPDQYNHMLAFRPRQRQKRSLRRTNRIVEDEIIQQLFQEFDLSLKAVDRVQMREALKYKQTQLQFLSFYSQCKSYCPQPDFLQDFKFEDRPKDKQKMKTLHTDIQSYKSRKESLQNIVLQDSGPNEVDQKLSIFNFLSNVVFEASLADVNFQRIFAAGSSSLNGLQRQKSTSANSSSINPIIEEPLIEKPLVEIKNPQQYLSISVKRYEDLIMRDFEQEQEFVYHVQPCKDFLEYKRRKVDRYYFGSDDQGETKDIRKNISTSFKKFQQLQSFPRTISAISEN